MSLSEAIAYVLEGHGGYKAAVKRFGVDHAMLKAAVIEARKAGRKPQPQILVTYDALEPAESLDELGESPAPVAAEYRRGKIDTVFAGAAGDVAAQLEPGGRLVGLTAGQFSMLDLVRSLLERTGPAHVDLCTWTIGQQDAETMAYMVHAGHVTGFRFLVDLSYRQRHPQYWARLVELFGAGSICTTHTHAKFAVIRADGWDICVRSSMNLNRNNKWEQYDIDDDPELCDFFAEFVSTVAARTGTGLVPTSDVTEARKGLIGEEASRRMAELQAARADPVGSSPVDFYGARLQQCVDMAALCEQAGQRSQAKEWEVQVRAYRQLYDSAVAEHEADERRREAMQTRNPEDLAARIIALAPALARMVPSQAEEIWAAIGKEIGK